MIRPTLLVSLETEPANVAGRSRANGRDSCPPTSTRGNESLGSDPEDLSRNGGETRGEKNQSSSQHNSRGGVPSDPAGKMNYGHSREDGWRMESGELG